MADFELPYSLRRPYGAGSAPRRRCSPSRLRPSPRSDPSGVAGHLRCARRLASLACSGASGASTITLKLLAVLLTLVALVGCGGPSYTMDAPSAFRRYAEADALRLITADGIRVAARTVDNEPVADLPFWVDAMKRHLDERGYALTSEQCFETQGGWDGCTVEFLLPYGAEDWVMSETVFVLGERLLLIEATGPFERFAAVADEYKAALRTVRTE